MGLLKTLSEAAVYRTLMSLMSPDAGALKAGIPVDVPAIRFSASVILLCRRFTMLRRRLNGGRPTSF